MRELHLRPVSLNYVADRVAYELKIPKTQAYTICLGVLDGWSKSLVARKYLAVDGFGVWSVAYKMPSALENKVKAAALAARSTEKRGRPAMSLIGVVPTYRPVVKFAPAPEMLEAYLEGFRISGSIQTKKASSYVEAPLAVVRVNRFGGD